MMTRLVVVAGLLLWAAVGRGIGLEPVTLRSHSGQFFVRGLPLAAPGPANALTSSVSYVRLDPTLLAVSCERIKAAVLEELAGNDLWRGKIFISLHPVRDDREPIVLTSLHYLDGWNYQMEIPEQVDGGRLIKSIVEVLLLETANRNARALSADLPLWLVEGLAARLQTAALATFTLEPETRIVRRERIQDPLGRIREQLRAHAPLSFGDLTWPSEEQLTEEKLPLYQSCAQLFVYELLRLREGQACLREMLAHLPEHLNWQTAFLRGFTSHFQTLRDVDKWWSLHLVHLTGQGPMSSWVRDETCKQLGDILATPVRVRLSAQELPFRTESKLQSILAEWGFERQRPLLATKLNLLEALRVRASADSAALVEEYRQALNAYLQQRAKWPKAARKGETSVEAKLLVSETIKRLDALDARRQVLCHSARATTAQLTVSP